MFFNPYTKQSRLSILAVTLMVTSAGCFGMETKKTTNTAYSTPQELKKAIELQLTTWKKARTFTKTGTDTEIFSLATDPHGEKINKATLLLHEVNLLEKQNQNWFTRFLCTPPLDYIRSGIAHGESRLKVFLINLSKAGAFFFGTNVIHNIILPIVNPGIATSITHGTIALGYTLTAAALSRMVLSVREQKRKTQTEKTLETLQAEWEKIQKLTEDREKAAAIVY